MSKPDCKPERPPRARAPSVVVSGRGKLMVRGDINIIEKQVIVNRPRRMRSRTPWRTVAIAAIKARCMAGFGDEYFYASFVREQFGKAALADLADDELQRVQQYVFAARNE